MMSTRGPALTQHIRITLLPTARHCVDYAADPATAKTGTNGDIVRLSSNMLAPTTGTRTGLFPTARSCADNARFLSPHWDEEEKSMKSDVIHILFQNSIFKIKS